MRAELFLFKQYKDLKQSVKILHDEEIFFETSNSNHMYSIKNKIVTNIKLM